MADSAQHIDALLAEERIFNPPAGLVENSNVMAWMRDHDIQTVEELYERAKNPNWFWPEVARDLVTWYRPHDKLLEWDRPFAKWFVGAEYNIAYDAVDRHAKSWRKNKVAFIYEGEPGDTRKITYGELAIEVNRLANGLRRLGVGKGDRVAIYMPMTPELPIAMLACAKLGAPHAVVFSGFSAAALRDRINDSGAKVVITADGFYRRGRVVNLKTLADEAVEQAPTVQSVVVYQRLGDAAENVPWHGARDYWWHELVAGESIECEPEHLDANDMLYLLYTSGTTGKPKGIIHAHGGYAVQTALTLKWVFDMKDEDIWWCAADIGWVTGHSYIVYAPLILGATSVLYEGAPDWPHPDRWWSMIERYRVTTLYTSPTSIRMFMDFEAPALVLLGLVDQREAAEIIRRGARGRKRRALPVGKPVELGAGDVVEDRLGRRLLDRVGRHSQARHQPAARWRVVDPVEGERRMQVRDPPDVGLVSLDPPRSRRRVEVHKRVAACRVVGLPRRSARRRRCGRKKGRRHERMLEHPTHGASPR